MPGHAGAARAMANFFNARDFNEGRVSKDDFPESLGLARTSVNISDHAGNHIDAPWHFGPIVEGKPAKTIDRIPLDWCFGPGLRLDFRHRQGRDIGPSDVKGELARIGARLEPGTIPLIWTGAEAAE